MSNTIITLTTDFGAASPYVAAMKGVILSIHPDANIVDLSHSIPPQDLLHTAFFLKSALPYFPPPTIHVVVVDPGVGTDRALLYVETCGIRLLAPDNGCWTMLPGESAPMVIRLTEPRYRRDAVSATFHGRDILAPVAAHLSRGLDPTLLGPTVDRWNTLDIPLPRAILNGYTGSVIFVDDFGNLITNIPTEWVKQKPDVLIVKGTALKKFSYTQTYGEAPAGSLVLLGSSVGLLEIAVVNGSAAKILRVGAGAAVAVGNR